jgi:hypothetical protein
VDETEHPDGDGVGAIPERALFRYADWEINLEVRAGAETAAEIFAAFCRDAQPELHRAGKREMTSWSTCQRAEDACQGESEAAAWDPPASVLHAAGSGPHDSGATRELGRRGGSWAEGASIGPGALFPFCFFLLFSISIHGF